MSYEIDGILILSMDPQGVYYLGARLWGRHMQTPQRGAPFNMGYEIDGILILGVDPQGVYQLGVRLWVCNLRARLPGFGVIRGVYHLGARLWDRHPCYMSCEGVDWWDTNYRYGPSGDILPGCRTLRQASANSTKRGSLIAIFMNPLGLWVALTWLRKSLRWGFWRRAFSSSLSPNFERTSTGSSASSASSSMKIRCCGFPELEVVSMKKELLLNFFASQSDLCSL